MKMRGRKGKFGRCPVPGHGQKCEVSQEITGTQVTRSQEKAEFRKEIEAEFIEQKRYMVFLLNSSI